jgi:hypothetical protein
MRRQLYKAMNDLGVSEKLTRMARATIENTSSSIRLQNSFSDPLDVTNGLRKGDAFACLLFNKALQKAITDSHIQTSRHIFAKSVQIIAYADDVLLIARTRKDLVEGFRSLESAAVRIGLKINENKTKYMGRNTRRLRDIPVLGIEPYTFEHVPTFAYVGTISTTDNNITKVRNTIAIGRCYFSLQKHFKSNFIYTNTKILLYKTLVRLIVLYGTECWTLPRMNEKMLDVFERKILRRIYGPVKDRDQWRCRYNKELCEFCKEPRLSVITRTARSRWAGHVTRMEENSVPRRLMYMQLVGRRKVGRPCARWKDDVRNDARMLGIRNWRATAINR